MAVGFTSRATRPCLCNERRKAAWVGGGRECRGGLRPPLANRRSKAWRARGGSAWLGRASRVVAPRAVTKESFVDGLKFDGSGLLVAIAQDVDSGAVLMQAFANREAVANTIETGLGTFWSRSRQSLWVKGETSSNFLRVQSVYADCDADSLIYFCKSDGPACHTGAHTCWFRGVALPSGGGGGALGELSARPMATLEMLERTISDRQEQMSGDAGKAKPSWTARLLSDDELLCSKVREEAGELCETLERGEGQQRAASEAADLIYHSMVLLRKQGVPLEDVLGVLRERFAQSGVEEKAGRA